MPIQFSSFVSVTSSAWKGVKAVHDWTTNASLKSDFQRYLAALEHRRVLYTSWEYENNQDILSSLSEILDCTRNFRADHNENVAISKLMGSLIRTLQKESGTIRSSNTPTPQSEFLAYRALLRIRGEMARTLAIICGLLDVDPRSTELENFIMNMAYVRPRA